MRRPAPGAPPPPYLLFYWMYMGFGTLSLLLGLVLWFAPTWLIAGAEAIRGVGLSVVSGILIVFGAVRIGLATRSLRIARRNRRQD